MKSQFAAAGVVKAGGVAVVLPSLAPTGAGAAGLTSERVSLVLFLAMVACLRPFLLSWSPATGALVALFYRCSL